MFCKFCGTKIDDNARFCCACGMKLVDSVPEAAPQPAPEPVYVAPEPTPEPVYTAPEPTYTAPQPAYSAPQAAYAPVQAEDSVGNVFKDNMLALIAAFTLGFFRFIELIRAIVNGSVGSSVMANMMGVGAAVLVVLAIFKVLKNKDLFYAIGMFALAGMELLFANGTLWYISALLMPAFGIAGVHYLLKGKVFNNLIKMIMAFAVAGIGFILVLFFISYHLPFYTIFSNFTMYAAAGLMILSYSPNK